MQHPFNPIYDKKSRILILGTFPSVKSREENFYYGNAQNRFWKVIAQIFEKPVPQNIEQKRKIILENALALWDVVKKCDIVGSSDSSIKNAEINDIAGLADLANINKIVFNGQTAAKLYKKYGIELNIKTVALPSTSPANAKYSKDMLVDIWKKELLLYE